MIGIGFTTVFFLTAASLVAHGVSYWIFIRYLRDNHRDIWDELGRPGQFITRAGSLISLYRFLLIDLNSRSQGDRKLIERAKALRFYAICNYLCAALFLVFYFLFATSAG